MLRADLHLTRLAWIAEGETEAEQRRRQDTDFLVYEKSVAEFFDFHACRHTYITFISETTRSLKQAQTLARVSTPRLLDSGGVARRHQVAHRGTNWHIGQPAPPPGTRPTGPRNRH